jgi:hypothetical protein
MQLQKNIQWKVGPKNPNGICEHFILKIRLFILIGFYFSGWFYVDVVLKKDRSVGMKRKAEN